MASNQGISPKKLRTLKVLQDGPMVSLLSGDLARFCMAYKVPLTHRMKSAQVELHVLLWNIMTGRTGKRRATPVNVPLMPEYARAAKHAAALGLPDGAQNKLYAAAARESARALTDEEDEEDAAAEDAAGRAYLATRTSRVLEKVGDVVQCLEEEQRTLTIRRCDTCKQGFAFVVGRKRPKDCEACRARLSPKQRWSRRQDRAAARTRVERSTRAERPTPTRR